MFVDDFILYSRYKRWAKHSKTLFSLKLEEFKEIVQKDCFYCGAKPKRIIKHYRKTINEEVYVNGVDRIDCSKGYEINNVVSSCSDCNYAKRCMSQ